MREFGSLVVAPGVPSSARLVASACAAGAVGVLDVVGSRDLAPARHALGELRRLCPDAVLGVRLAADDAAGLELAGEPGPGRGVAVLAPATDAEVAAALVSLRSKCDTLLVEVLDAAAAVAAERAGADAVVAVGHESGGEVSELTTLVLLQVLTPATSLPVWVRGGIGLHSAAACFVAGAAGFVLDAQLTLAAESAAPEAVRRSVAHVDGGDTRLLGARLGHPVRVLARPGSPTLARLDALAAEARPDTWPGLCRRDVRPVLARADDPDPVLPLGQDAALAGPLARRFRTAGGIVAGIREAARANALLAQRHRTLREDAPLARSHGCRLPVAQGPMTRVSDDPGFVQAVAEAGALPFLALGLADRTVAEELVRRTADLLGDRPWGVGILGFVPPELRAQQAAALEACPPPYALIAGGRPDQAAALERRGVRTYLHVPAPTLLELFAAEGARRFVLEGRECGGHVGPRSSLVLWDQAVETLLELPDAELARCHLLLAGGVHDGVSAAAAVTLAAPLVERGVRVGVLLGTAYTMTEEAVATGAVTPAFQDVAIGCTGTVLLETGPGHASRCARTPYAETFERERTRLRAAGAEDDAVREELEALNLGRLRIATKGLARGADGGLRAVQPSEQVEDGMFMLGDATILCGERRSLASLHHELTHTSRRVLDELCGPAWSRPAARSGTDVAIIGMSCLLPGAPDIATYWDNVLTGVDAITEVPEHRWRAADYFDPDPAVPDRIYSRWGGFLDPVTIDPVRWGIPPAAVPSIEPVQLLALHCAEAALADSGYAERDFARDRTSVVFGIGGGIADLGQRYAVRSGLPMYVDGVAGGPPDGLPEWTEDSFAGILLNVVPGRIANRLDLGGVNIAVDAACASSLAALQVAVRELAQGSSDLVLAGGADTVQNPFGYLCFSKARALSPRGRCRSFDAGADGIVISEGLAVVVLKRLADAERDGDRVYAVVKGVGGSSDGRGLSLTAPRVAGQVLALRRAYADAGISPRTVGLVEAHGTGTVAGDRAELTALAQVYAADGAAPGSCSLGSVKSMIGHTKCAAGLAGLVKAALALHHQVLPTTLHVEEPNPALTDPASPFRLEGEPRPWVHTAATPRRAAVSSFGFGGVNLHAVLEEHVGDAPPPSRRWPAELFLLAAGTAEELEEQLVELAGVSAGLPAPALVGLAERWCASAVARAATDPGPLLRCAVLAGSAGDLRAGAERLGAVLHRGGPLAWIDPRGTTLAAAAARQPEGSVAFLFPGQGSQYPGMLQDLAARLPQVRAVVERAEDLLRGRLDEPLSALLFPPRRFSEASRAADAAALTRTEVAQPALGAVSLALARLLEECGVRPGVLAGHSYGEYVALCRAGALSADALVLLSFERGRCLRDAGAAAPGGMLAAAACEEDVRRALGDHAGATLANLNSPRQTVLAGSVEALAEAGRALSAAGIPSRALPVACAFHSPLVAPATDALRTVLADAPLRAPTLPVLANTTATAYPTDQDGTRALLGRHLGEPVRFLDQVEAMYAAGARTFVEVGPRAVLSGLVDETLGDRPHRTVPTDVPGRAGTTAFLGALARLFVAGVPVDPAPLTRGRSSTRAAPVGSRTAWSVDGGRSVRVRLAASPAPLPPDLVAARQPGPRQPEPGQRGQVVMRP